MLNQIVEAYLKKAVGETVVNPESMVAPQAAISNSFKSYVKTYKEDIMAFMLGELEKSVLQGVDAQGNAQLSKDWSGDVKAYLNGLFQKIEKGII